MKIFPATEQSQRVNLLQSEAQRLEDMANRLTTLDAIEKSLQTATVLLDHQARNLYIGEDVLLTGTYRRPDSDGNIDLNHGFIQCNPLIGTSFGFTHRITHESTEWLQHHPDSLTLDYDPDVEQILTRGNIYHSVFIGIIAVQGDLGAQFIARHAKGSVSSSKVTRVSDINYQEHAKISRRVNFTKGPAAELVDTLQNTKSQERYIALGTLLSNYATEKRLPSELINRFGSLLIYGLDMKNRTSIIEATAIYHADRNGMYKERPTRRVMARPSAIFVGPASLTSGMAVEPGEPKTQSYLSAVTISDMQHRAHRVLIPLTNITGYQHHREEVF